MCRIYQFAIGIHAEYDFCPGQTKQSRPHLKQGEYRQVLGNIARLPEWLSPDGIKAAYTLGIFANVALGDYAAARQVSQDYARLSPGDASDLVFLKEYIAGAEGILVRDQGGNQQITTEQADETPEAFSLQATPNPFNPETRITFALPHEGEVSIRIFDLMGREVRVWEKLRKSAGAHAISWDGRDKTGVAVGSGLYIYRLVYQATETGATPIVQSRKMTLVR